MRMPLPIRGLVLIVALSLVWPAVRATAEETPFPCDQAEAKIMQAQPNQRVPLAEGAIKASCRPIPAPILNVLRTGTWPDNAPIAPQGRITLLVRATEAAYAEAETLTVGMLENGAWPEGSQIAFDDGANLIRSLKPVLTRFRGRLLLDVYEQIRIPAVRQAVLHTLRGADFEEALLPALDAVYEETGPLQVSGLTTIAEEPEKVPAEVHARLIRKLPEGPLLAWAVRLANSHSSPAVQAARKERGIN